MNGGWYWQALSRRDGARLRAADRHRTRLEAARPEAGHAGRRRSHLHHARPRQRDRGAARRARPGRGRGRASSPARSRSWRSAYCAPPELRSHHDATSAGRRDRDRRASASSPGSGTRRWRSPAPPSASPLLALRQELHGFVERLDADDVKALARYAVIAGAVLPFLPSGHYGPLGAWNPQRLWLVVVLVTGFSFLGYVANRIFGERHGTIATALIGGAYSSTAVTQSLAQRLGSEEPGRRRARGNRACNRGHVPARAGADRRCSRRARCPRSRIMLLPARRRRLGRGLLALPHGAEIAMRQPRPAIRSRSCPRSALSLSSPWPRSPRPGPRAVRPERHRRAAADRRQHGRRYRHHHARRTAAGAISPLLAAIAIGGTIIVNMAVKIGITLVYARGKGLSAALAMAASVLVARNLDRRSPGLQL